ncbi:hypothetical protein DIR46_12260 [Massilia oculi]|uniref:Uncharacterized protein n=1 Tax=Massilia oculi TaxID=945844 RepID=A0A2S2DJU0_9BURK|nr:hypothetical protein DIR46_12260 [Massilia oculi]
MLRRRNEQGETVGNKTAILAYVDEGSDLHSVLKSRPVLDREATALALAELFPSHKAMPLADGHLGSVYPPRDEVGIACYPGLTIVSAQALIVEPSQLDQRFLEFAKGRTMLHHVTISTVDAFSYGVWKNGELVRALSMSSDGVTEDIGAPRAVELPYWAGKYPCADDDEVDDGLVELDEHDRPEFGDDLEGSAVDRHAGSLPFHPLELGDAVLLDLFGYALDGYDAETQLDPDSIALMRFTLRQTARQQTGSDPVVGMRPWWKFW